MVMLKDAVDVSSEDHSFDIPPLPPPIVTIPSTPKKGGKSLKPVEQCAVKVNTFGVRMHNDKSPCDITGSTIMPDGRLVLVDYNNKKLKVLDRDYKLVSDYKTDGASFDATTLSDNQVAATVPKEKRIQFLSLQDGIKAADSIQTRLECWGIEYVDEKLVTVTNGDDHMILFLNLKGIELISCSLGSQDPNMKWPISVCVSTKEKVYVCCQGEGDSDEINGCLVIIDSAAQVRSMYMDPGLRKPTSCTKDEDGNIFICGLTSANVHQIPRAGDRLAQIISGLSKPIHIKCCRETNTLLVMERFSNDVSVYQMQE